MKRLIAISLVLLTLGATGRATPRSQVLQNAEATFFRALNDDISLRKAALRELQTAAAVDPKDARTALLLGLCHLWIATEGSRVDPAEVDHVILAEHFLERAQELNPTDDRIPTWLVPTKLALLSIQGKPEESKAVYGSLLKAYETDPAFHSFSIALLNFDEPRDSERFRSGLEALRGVPPCADDPVCQDHPRWPHNSEAALTFVADYELKAGDTDRARVALEQAKGSPGFLTWRHAKDAEDRLANLEAYAARYANEDKNDDPPRPQIQCVACHGK